MTRALLARRERVALCDLALVLGEDAPTLCGDWTAKDLVTHLLVRERSPLAGVGIAIPPLSSVTDREMARVARTDFAVLVERLRGHGLTLLALPPLDKLFNTVEYFVHHEDLRRAQPGWSPRDLDPGDRDQLWRPVKAYGGRFLKDAQVPVVATRTDTGETVTLLKGDDPVELSGPPEEVLFGRDETSGLEIRGSEAAVEAVRSAKRAV